MMQLSKVREVPMGPSRVGNRHPLVLLAGPSLLEDEDEALLVARELRDLTRALRIGFVFRTSCDKPDRSSGDAQRGPGAQAGLESLARIRADAEVPVLCEVHDPAGAARTAELCDAVEVPSHRCLDTDLLRACAETGKPVSVVKGPFLSPWEVGVLVRKLEGAGAAGVLVTEAGATHGYGNLVVDPRSFPVIRGLGVPVSLDATRACRLPGARGDASGGRREFAVHLARAAAAAGLDALSLAVHPEPERAACDPDVQLALSDVHDFMLDVLAVDRVVRGGARYQ